MSNPGKSVYGTAKGTITVIDSRKRASEPISHTTLQKRIHTWSNSPDPKTTNQPLPTKTSLKAAALMHEIDTIRNELPWKGGKSKGKTLAPKQEEKEKELNEYLDALAKDAISLDFAIQRIDAYIAKEKKDEEICIENEKKLKDDEEEYKRKIKENKAALIVAKGHEKRALQNDELRKKCAELQSRQETQKQVEDIDSEIKEQHVELKRLDEEIASKIKKTSLLFHALNQFQFKATDETTNKLSMADDKPNDDDSPSKRLKLSDKMKSGGEKLSHQQQEDSQEEEEGAVPMIVES